MKQLEVKELGWDDVEPVDRVGLEVGYRFIHLVDKNQGGQLLNRMKGVRRKLSQELGFANTKREPKITKVVLNMGLGEAVADKKILENATNDLELISGQKVVVTKARKSIAGFKIRDGWPIGCKVTLRGERMYEFLERLVNIAIPRIRAVSYTHLTLPTKA